MTIPNPAACQDNIASYSGAPAAKGMKTSPAGFVYPGGPVRVPLMFTFVVVVRPPLMLLPVAVQLVELVHLMAYEE